MLQAIELGEKSLWTQKSDDPPFTLPSIDENMVEPSYKFYGTSTILHHTFIPIRGS